MTPDTDQSNGASLRGLRRENSEKKLGCSEGILHQRSPNRQNRQSAAALRLNHTRRCCQTWHGQNMPHSPPPHVKQPELCSRNGTTKPCSIILYRHLQRCSMVTFTLSLDARKGKKWVLNFRSNHATYPSNTKFPGNRTHATPHTRTCGHFVLFIMCQLFHDLGAELQFSFRFCVLFLFSSCPLGKKGQCPPCSTQNQHR